MDFAVTRLGILGPVVFGAGLAIWGLTNGNKTSALWAGFFGLFMILVAMTLHLQQSIWKDEAAAKDQGPTAAEIAAKQSRAYVLLEDVEMSNIADDTGVVGKVPMIRIVIKNSGQTPAYGVVHQTAARLAPFPPPPDLFRMPSLPPQSVDIIAAGSSSLAVVGLDNPINMDRVTMLGFGTMAVYVFGQITYQDASEANAARTIV